MSCNTIITKRTNNSKRRYFDNDVAKENWMALTIAICTRKTCEQSLAAMGIVPEAKPKRSDCVFQDKACIAYVLNRVCGLKVKEITKCLGIGKTTVNRAIGSVSESIIYKECEV